MLDPDLSSQSRDPKPRSDPGGQRRRVVNGRSDGECDNSMGGVEMSKPCDNKWISRMAFMIRHFICFCIVERSLRTVW